MTFLVLVPAPIRCTIRLTLINFPSSEDNTRTLTRRQSQGILYLTYPTLSSQLFGRYEIPWTSSGVILHASTRCSQVAGRFMSCAVYSLVAYEVHARALMPPQNMSSFWRSSSSCFLRSSSNRSWSSTSRRHSSRMRSCCATSFSHSRRRAFMVPGYKGQLKKCRYKLTLTKRKANDASSPYVINLHPSRDIIRRAFPGSNSVVSSEDGLRRTANSEWGIVGERIVRKEDVLIGNQWTC